jgi:hypothetical protein
MLPSALVDTGQTDHLSLTHHFIMHEWLKALYSVAVLSLESSHSLPILQEQHPSLTTLPLPNMVTNQALIAVTYQALCLPLPDIFYWKHLGGS